MEMGWLTRRSDLPVTADPPIEARNSLRLALPLVESLYVNSARAYSIRNSNSPLRRITFVEGGDPLGIYLHGLDKVALTRADG
jgi:hypothetical protein